MLTIELQDHFAVTPATAWKTIADVLRQRDYVAYQITHAKQSNAANLGPEFKWKESGVLLGRRYECECCVFGWEPPEWLCFGTKDLFHVSFELAAKDGGTALAYRCELPQTPDSLRETLEELCRQSLTNLKMQLERGVKANATWEV